MRINYLAAMGGSSALSFLIDENCEGTGTPAGWTNVSGSPNWDYTTVPLEAAQSLYLSSAAAAARARVDFTDQTEIWVYFRLRFTNGSAPGAGITIGGLSANGNGSPQVLLNINATPKFVFAGVSPVTTLAADTTYHVWLHYKQGTGANAVADIGFSTDGVRPTSGNNFAQTTTGSQTNLAGRLWLGPNTAAGWDEIWDKMRVATSQIGDNGDF